MSVTEALQTAARRRQPLLVLVTKTPEEGRTLLCSARIASMAVVHSVVEGSQEFEQLASASNAVAVPRCHVFPPPMRMLPPLVLTDNELTPAHIARVVMTATEFTEPEVRTTQEAAQKVATAITAAVTTIHAPTSSLRVPESMSRPEQRPREIEKLAVRLSNAPEGTPDSVQVNARGNTTLKLLRHELQQCLGHGNFHFVHPARTLSHRDEERMVMRDIIVEGMPSIVLTQAEVAKLLHRKPKPTDDERTHTEEPVLLLFSLPEGCEGTELEIEARPSGDLGDAWVRLSAALRGDVFTVEARHLGDARQAVPVDSSTLVSEVASSQLIVTRQRSKPAAAEGRHIDPCLVDGPTSMKLRLALPTGSSVDFEVSPADPLQLAQLRAVQELGHEKFSLVGGYPPVKYTPTQFAASFAELKIRNGVTLRVVPHDGFIPRDDDSPASEETKPQETEETGVLQRLSAPLRWLRGSESQGAQGQSPAAPPRTPPPARTLGELARREANGKDSKKNEYYGGAGTVFKDRNDDE